MGNHLWAGKPSRCAHSVLQSIPVVIFVSVIRDCMKRFVVHHTLQICTRMTIYGDIFMAANEDAELL